MSGDGLRWPQRGRATQKASAAQALQRRGRGAPFGFQQASSGHLAQHRGREGRRRDPLMAAIWHRPGQPAACLRLAAMWSPNAPTPSGDGRPPSGPVVASQPPPKHYIHQRHIPCASCMWLRSDGVAAGPRILGWRIHASMSAIPHHSGTPCLFAMSFSLFVGIPCLFARLSSQRGKRETLSNCIFV